VSSARRALVQRLGLGLCAFSALLFAPSLEDAYVLPQRLALTLGVALLALGAPPRQRFGGLAWLGLGWLAWRLLCRAIADPVGSHWAWLAEQAPLWGLLLFAGTAVAERPRWSAALLLTAGALGSLFALLPSLGFDPWSRGAVDLGFGARLHGSLGNPDFLGGWLCLLLPLGVAVALSAEGRERVLALAASALMAAVLLLSGARAACLAGALGCTLALAALRPRLLGLTRLAALGALAALTLILALWQPGLLPGRLREAATPGSDAWRSRAFMASCAIDLAKEHPLVGVGPGGFGNAYLQRQGALLSAGAREPYRFTFDAHNDWLQVAAESGWLGLFAWALLWLWTLRTAWRRGGPAGAALAGGLLAFAVQGCFHFPWAVWPSAALYLLGLSVGAQWQADAKAPLLPVPGWMVALLLLGAIALGYRQAASSALLNAGHVAEMVPAARGYAVPLYATAGRLRPEDARTWQALAGRDQADGRWDAAIEAYQAALREQPGQADLWVNMALCLAQQGSLDPADAMAQRGLFLNPRSPQAWIDASKIVWLRGDALRAERMLRQGLDAAGPSAQASFNLGAILYNGRRFKEAAQAFQAVLALEPQHAEAQRLLKESLRAH
jgi:tetratricopeptide (TPR) repeat protein